MRALLAFAAALVIGTLIAFASSPAKAQVSVWSPGAGSIGNDRYSGEVPSMPFQTPSYAPTPHSAIQHHASTAYEGASRGIAAIIKARAEGQMSLAQARILYAEAHAREMRNEVIRTQTFLARKNALKEDFRQDQVRKWEWLDQARERREDREQSVLRTVYHVPSTQLNRLTGEITWPAALMAPELASQRDDVQEVISRLSSHGPDYARQHGGSAVHAIETLRDALRSQRSTLGVEPRDYFECQSFLVGLKLEAQSWAADGDLAMVASR
jgi:hypothetical protein